MKLSFLLIIIGTLGACVSTKGTIQTGATELISTPKSTKVIVFAENYNQDFKGFIADSLKQNLPYLSIPTIPESPPSSDRLLKLIQFFLPFLKLLQQLVG